jgi:hypothetical protein
VVAFSFDIEHIDSTKNGRTREKREDEREREEVIPSFHGLREGDDNHGVGASGEKATLCSGVRRGEVVAKWCFPSLRRPF